MGHKLPAMIQDLSKSRRSTASMFQKVFGTEVTKEGVAKAIAAFERTILSGNSPYDRYKAGDKNALNEAQKRGMELFDDKGACGTCHTPAGVQQLSVSERGSRHGQDEARRRPQGRDQQGQRPGQVPRAALREVANTAPYFHDGSVATLEDAVALMAAGGKDNPNLSPIFKVAPRAPSSPSRTTRTWSSSSRPCPASTRSSKPPKLP